jgi:uncharacterized membrane protein YgcG
MANGRMWFAAISAVIYVSLAACSTGAPQLTTEPAPDHAPAPSASFPTPARPPSSLPSSSPPVAAVDATPAAAEQSSAPAPQLPAPGPPFPPPRDGTVIYDYAGVFSAEAEESAAALIDRLANEALLALTVFTQYKPGATTESTAADAAALIDQWVADRPALHDGLVIFVNTTRHVCRAAVPGNGQLQLYAGAGDAAQALPSRERQRIFDEDLLPLLTDCDLDGALLVALERIAATARSAEATLTAAPSPVDVADVFVRRMLFGRSWTAAISGTIVVGDVSIAVSGLSQSGSGDDSLIEFMLEMPDGTTIAEAELTVGSERFVRYNGGPWVEQPAPSVEEEPAGNEALQTLFESIVGVTDVGVVARGGRTLHRLVPPPDVVLDPAALGIDDPSLRRVTASVEFFAEPDGTPSVMAVTAEWRFRQRSHRIPARLALDLTFESFGAPVTIEPPRDAWQSYDGEAYRMLAGYPRGWDLERAPAEEGGDVMLAPYGDAITARSLKAPRANLRDETLDIIRYWRDEYGLSAEANEEHMVDAVPARVVAMRSDDTAAMNYIATVIRGNRLYMFTLHTDADRDLAGRQLFEDFLTTVRFTD